MAVAAMVARQMRENQERKDGPNSNWTEEERNLYELQQKSKSKLKVLLILRREYCKIIVSFYFSVRFSAGYSGEKQASTSWSSQVLQLPLLLSLLLLLLGLLLVSLSLYDPSKTSIAVKCLGSGLVLTGTSAVLLRILYSSSPPSLNFKSVRTSKNTRYKCGKNM